MLLLKNPIVIWLASQINEIGIHILVDNLVSKSLKRLQLLILEPSPWIISWILQLVKIDILALDF